jgi:hypothetical protein
MPALVCLPWVLCTQRPGQVAVPNQNGLQHPAEASQTGFLLSAAAQEVGLAKLHRMPLCPSTCFSTSPCSAVHAAASSCADALTELHSCMMSSRAISALLSSHGQLVPQGRPAGNNSPDLSSLNHAQAACPFAPGCKRTTAASGASAMLALGLHLKLHDAAHTRGRKGAYEPAAGPRICASFHL